MLALLAALWVPHGITAQVVVADGERYGGPSNEFVTRVQCDPALVVCAMAGVFEDRVSIGGAVAEAARGGEPELFIAGNLAGLTGEQPNAWVVTITTVTPGQTAYVSGLKTLPDGTVRFSIASLAGLIVQGDTLRAEGLFVGQIDPTGHIERLEPLSTQAWTWSGGLEVDSLLATYVSGYFHQDFTFSGIDLQGPGASGSGGHLFMAKYSPDWDEEAIVAVEGLGGISLGIEGTIEGGVLGLGMMAGEVSFGHLVLGDGGSSRPLRYILAKASPDLEPEWIAAFGDHASGRVVFTSGRNGAFMAGLLAGDVTFNGELLVDHNDDRNSRTYVAALDASGQLRWAREVSSEGLAVHGVRELHDGRILVMLVISGVTDIFGQSLAFQPGTLVGVLLSPEGAYLRSSELAQPVLVLPDSDPMGPVTTESLWFSASFRDSTHLNGFGQLTSAGEYDLLVGRIRDAPTAGSVIPTQTAVSCTAYPNPATSRVTLEGEWGKSYSVLDMLGRVVRTHSYAYPADGMTIDLGGLPAGLYWISGGNGCGQPLVLVSR